MVVILCRDLHSHVLIQINQWVEGATESWQGATVANREFFIAKLNFYRAHI